MIVLNLPLPPSDNAIYGVVQYGRTALLKMIVEYKAGRIDAGGFIERAIDVVEHKLGRVYLTDEVREFRKAVERVVRDQLKPPPNLAGRLAVKVDLNMPNLTQRDITNYLKSLLDALTHARVWVDDEQIDYCLVTRGRLIRGRGQCTVQIVQTSAKVEQLALPEVEAVVDMLPF